MGKEYFKCLKCGMEIDKEIICDNCGEAELQHTDCADNEALRDRVVELEAYNDDVRDYIHEIDKLTSRAIRAEAQAEWYKKTLKKIIRGRFDARTAASDMQSLAHKALECGE